MMKSLTLPRRQYGTGKYDRASQPIHATGSRRSAAEGASEIYADIADFIECAVLCHLVAGANDLMASDANDTDGRARIDVLTSIARW